MRWVLRDRLARGAVRLTVLLLFAGIGLSFALATKPVESPVMSGTAKPSFSESEICADLVLSQTAGCGDVISVERVYTRRMRKGPFLLAVREMVAENLSMTLPESYFAPPAKTASAEKTEGSGELPQLVGTLSSGGGRVRDLMPNVAGFVVRGLCVARLEGGTNAVPWLKATGGRAEQGGLLLRNVLAIESGRTNALNDAFLEFSPCVRLR